MDVIMQGEILAKNNLTVAGKKIEPLILSELKEKVVTIDNVAYVFNNMEEIVNLELHKVPEIVKKKNSQYEKLLSEIQIYLNFIRKGNFSKTVSEALTTSETKSLDLK